MLFLQANFSQANLEPIALYIMKINTSGGAKSHRLVESRIGRPCALGSYAPKQNYHNFRVVGPCATFL